MPMVIGLGSDLFADVCKAIFLYLMDSLKVMIGDSRSRPGEFCGEEVAVVDLCNIGREDSSIVHDHWTWPISISTSLSSSATAIAFFSLSTCRARRVSFACGGLLSRCTLCFFLVHLTLLLSDVFRPTTFCCLLP